MFSLQGHYRRNSDIIDQSRSYSWRMLQLAFFYRLTLSLTLITLFIADIGPLFLGSNNPALYALVSIAYFGLVTASGIPLYLRSPNPHQQSHLLVYLDIVAITILMHASGGITTGLGMLLLISIASGSAVMRGRTAIVFAAIATVSILGEQLFSQIHGSFPDTAYTQTGILGASFFAIAILSDALSRNLRESEQRVSQRELDMANLEQLNDYIIQHMQAGIIVVDIHQRIRLMNEHAWYLLGMPDANTGQLLQQASPELSSELNIWQNDNTSSPQPFHTTPGRRELQAKFSKLGDSQQTGAMIHVEDTATLTRRAQQMKLASLGRLTVSIAHEIRNPLGAISHAQQLLGESPRLDQADKRLNEIIHTNTDRVNDIIESVMKLSRRQQSHPDSIELTTWLNTFMEEFSHTHKLASGTLKISVPPKNTIVQADPTQLRQLLTNLCENSICHFHQDRKKLLISINGGTSHESGGAFLEIIDNGPGIKPDVARQVFEPFFTTRNAGTGLGLYIAKELSEANSLELEYKPTPMGGSCFHISFPEVQPMSR
ncbi:MAG: histidine kinase [Gammaproteobacteria bacterium]|nr:histidine kinase [Gammaproteobacteria bacterium]